MNRLAPTPWKYCVDDSKAVVLSNDDRLLAEVCYLNFDPDANGKLIASAPELKATLEEMVQAAKRVKAGYDKLASVDAYCAGTAEECAQADDALVEVTSKAQALLAKLNQ